MAELRPVSENLNLQGDGLDAGPTDNGFTPQNGHATHATPARRADAIGGYGAGEMTIDEDSCRRHKTDIDMTMAALGIRGEILDAEAGDPLDVAVRSEALWLRTTADKTEHMEFEAEHRLDAEVGYGIGAPRGFGVVTPYAGPTIADGAQRTVSRTGLRWNASQRATVGLEATREDQGADARRRPTRSCSERRCGSEAPEEALRSRTSPGSRTTGQRRCEESRTQRAGTLSPAGAGLDDPNDRAHRPSQPDNIPRRSPANECAAIRQGQGQGLRPLTH